MTSKNKFIIFFKNKIVLRVCLVLLVVLAILFVGDQSQIKTTKAAAVTCYWVGDTNWNDAAHWSSSSGGGGNSCDTPASVPGSDDIATFTSANTNNANIDVNVNVKGLSINTGYTGIISQDAGKTVAIGTSGFSQVAGTYSATESMTINSNSSNAFIKSGGTFDEGTGKVTFTGIVGTYDVNDTETFYDVEINVNNTSYLTITAVDTMVVSHTLTLTEGMVNAGTIDTRGDTNQVANFDGGTATLDFGDNGVVQTYFTAGGTGPNIRFDHSLDANDFVDFSTTDAGFNGLIITIDFGANPVPIDYNGHNMTLGISGFSQAIGTFTAPAALTINSLSGGPNNAFIKSGGTFDKGTGSITFTSNSGGVGTYNVATTETFYDVTINNGGYLTMSGDTMVVSHTLTLTNGMVNAGTIDTRGDTNQADTFDGGNATLDFGDDLAVQTYITAGGIGPTLHFDDPDDASDHVHFDANASFSGINIALGFGANTVPMDYGGFNLTLVYDYGTGYTQAVGTFIAPAILTLKSDNAFTKSGGTFTEGTNSVVFQYTGISTGTYNVATTETFYDVTINNSNTKTFTITAVDTMVVSHTLTLTDGMVQAGTIDTRGDTNQSADFDGGNATLDFGDNDVPQTYTTAGGIGPIIRFDHSSDANDFVHFDASASFDGINIALAFGANAVPMVYNGFNLTLVYDYGNGFTQAAGTFTAPATMTIKSMTNTFNKSGGTFVEGTGTVIFQIGAAGTYNVDATETFYDVTISSSPAGRALTITAGDTMVISHTLLLTEGSVATGTMDAQGDVTVASTYDGGTASLKFSAGNTQSFDLTGATGLFNADITVNKSGGQVNLLSALVMDTASQDLTIEAGVFDINNNALTTNGTSSTLVVQSGGTLQLRGGETITTNLYNPQIQSGSTIKYDGVAGPYTLKNYLYSNLAIDGLGATFNLPTTIFVEGNLTMTAGNLDVTASNYDLTVMGNCLISDTFTPRSGKVTLNGAAASLSSTSAFYDLDIVNPTVTDPVAYWKLNETVAGDPVVDSSGNGYTGTPVHLPPPSVDVPTQIHFADARSLDFDGTNDYVNNTDVTEVNGATALTVSTWVKFDTLTTDEALVTKGDNVDNEALLLYRDEIGSTSGRTDTFTVSVGDGVAQAKIEGTTGIANDTNWHHLAATYTASSATGLRLYVDGIEDANSPVSTAAIASLKNAVTPVELAQTNNNLWRLNGKLDDVRIYNRAISGAQAEYLAAGYDASTNVSVTLGSGINIDNDLNIGTDSTLNASAGAYDTNVGGDWTNAGTFTPGNNSVIFDRAADTQILISGGTAAGKLFHHVVHSGAGTLQLSTNDLNIDGNFTNSGGTFDTNGKDITVAGNVDLTTGSFTEGARTMTLDGSTAQSFTAGGTGAGHTPYNLTIANTSGVLNGVTFTDSLTLAAGGTFSDNIQDSRMIFADNGTYVFSILDIDGAVGHNILMQKGAGAHGHWHFNIPGAPVVTYVTPSNSDASGGSEINDVTGGLDGGGNTHWDFGLPPDPPTNATLTVDSSTQLTAHWTDNSTNEIGFKVYISVLSNADCSAAIYLGAPNYTPAAGATSQALSGLSVNSRYCFKVDATNAYGDSAPPAYAAAPVYTLADAPGAPTVNATSTTSLTTIIDVATNPASTEFAIFGCGAATLSINFTTKACDTILDDTNHWRTFADWGGSSGFTQTGLTPGTQYRYFIVARNGNKVTSSPSASTFGTTLSDSGIDNPTNFSGSAGDSQDNLVWQNPTSANFSHIHVYRTESDGGTMNLIADDITGTSYTDTGLTNGQTYYYMLKAVSATDQLSSGTDILGLTPTLAAPTRFRVNAVSSTQIVLRWSPVEGEVYGYNLYNADNDLLLGTTTDHIYYLTGLTPNTTYSFYLRTVGLSGNLSERSEIVTATTSSEVTEEPTGKIVFLILTGVPEEVAINKPLPNKVTVTGADAGGAVVKNYLGRIYFTSSDQKAKLTWNLSNPFSFSNQAQGTHQFSGSDFTFKTIGEQSLTVTDGQAKGVANFKVVGSGFFERSRLVMLKVFDTIKKYILNGDYTKAFSKINTILFATVMALFLITALINIVIGLTDIISQQIYWILQFLQFLGIRKKRQPWGVVFNSQTGQTLPFATVRIYDKKYDRLLEMAMTDQAGRFGFLVRFGTFYLVVKKTGYAFPSRDKTSNFFDDIYTAGEIEISQKDEGVVNLNIPLDPQTKAPTSFSFMITLIKINHFLQKIRLPILIVGTLMAILMIITAYHILYVLSLMLYIGLFIYEYFRSKKIRPYGILSDISGTPLEMAIIRIYDQKTSHLISTEVTDDQGRYKFLVNPGVYYLTAAKPGYLDFESHEMKLEKEETLVSSNIKLKKVE